MSPRSNDNRDLNRIFRLNLVNLISGIKPANFIGTAFYKEMRQLGEFHRYNYF